MHHSGLAATMSQRADNSNRTGVKGKIFSVRRDPNLSRKDIIIDKNSHKFQFIAGSTYKGDWKDNEKHGFGIQTFPDGTKYEGEWISGKQHGIGTLWIKQGKQSVKRYVGNWINGKMDGSGVYSYPNGDIYSGEWLEGKRSGNGKLEYANGDVYIGNWYKDRQHGNGILTAANGNRYDGHWTDGIKQGPGKYYYASTNKVYEGEWIDDCPRCGEFRDPLESEIIYIGSSALPRHPFDLPELTLQSSRAVLDCSIASTRLECSIKEGLSHSGIDETRMNTAERCFADLDTNGTGCVETLYLGSVFSALGVYITPEELTFVMNQFQMNDVSDLSFPEVVEIASFLLENS